MIVHYLILFMIRQLVFFAETWIANTYDTDDSGKKVQFQKKKFIVITGYLFCSALFEKGTGIAVGVAASVFWGSIAAAAYSDWQIKYAYDFMNWIAVLAAIITLLLAKQSNTRDIIIVAVFFLLQVTVCRLFYGAADCIVCSAVAIYLTAFGRRIDVVLLFLLTALILAFIVQLLKGNVNKKGNLKEVIPLIPYMVVALLIIM